jgi:large subunit ribosomal protein L3
MALGLLGYKIGMMQVFEENGNVAPVTVLQLGPCPVLQIRTPRTRRLHGRAGGLSGQVA